MASLQRNINTNFISAAKGIALSGSSLIGPSKCTKCIIDEDGKFELTSSVLKLLQIIKVDHPAISIIYDVCQGFHKAYGTCCTTLVFMMGSWLQSMELLLDQGLPLPIINHLLKEAVDICTEEADRLSISVDELPKLFKKHESMTEDRQRNFSEIERQLLSKIQVDRSKSIDRNFVGRTYAASNISDESSNHRKIGHGKVLKFSSRYSRHFAEADNLQRKEEALRNLSNGIESLSFAVARGNKIVEQLVIRLLELGKKSRGGARNLSELQIPLDNVFVEFVTGKSETESAVIEGLCFNVNQADIGELTHLFENKSVKICLIDFDKMKHSKNFVSQSSSAEDDVQKLVRFQVSCVMYHGDDSGIKEGCHSKGIIPLRINTAEQLYAISKATGNPVLSSLSELQLKDRIAPVKLSFVGQFHEARSGKGYTASRSVVSVCFLTVSEERYFTIVLCGMTFALVALLEERIWSCLHRLNNILNSGKFVYGSGSIERKCARHLLDFSGRTLPSPRRSVPRWMEQELQIYRRTVFTEVAKGLGRYCLVLSQSIDQSATKRLVIDDVLSKCEAWRRAMRFSRSIMNPVLSDESSQDSITSTPLTSITEIQRYFASQLQCQ